MAVGKVLFSMAEPRIVDSYCRKEFGHVSSEKAISFKAELAAAAVSGFAEAENVDGSGVYGASMPVNGVPGVPFALAISMPLARFAGDSKSRMKRPLRKYSQELEASFKNAISRSI